MNDLGTCKAGGPGGTHPNYGKPHIAVEGKFEGRPRSSCRACGRWLGTSPGIGGQQTTVAVYYQGQAPDGPPAEFTTRERAEQLKSGGRAQSINHGKAIRIMTVRPSMAGVRESRKLGWQKLPSGCVTTMQLSGEVDTVKRGRTKISRGPEYCSARDVNFVPKSLESATVRP